MSFGAKFVVAFGWVLLWCSAASVFFFQEPWHCLFPAGASILLILFGELLKRLDIIIANLSKN